MRTNAPDEGTAGDTAFCAACGKPMKPEAALCTACGTRRDGEAETTRVVAGEPVEPAGAADRGPEATQTPAVREPRAPAADPEEERPGAVRWLGWVAAGVVTLFAVLLLLWATGGPSAGPAPSRAVRVLPLFADAGRLLLVHREEVAAAGAGAAVLVELDSMPGSGGRPELVPVAGGAAAPGVVFADAGAGSAVRIDLRPLAAGGPSALLPVRPPDRYFERPAPDDPQRHEATAGYEAEGFEGDLRLATGSGEPVSSSGTLTVRSEQNPSLSASLTWAGEHLDVTTGAGVRTAWAGGSSETPAGPGGPATLLFVLPDGAPPAVGAYEVRSGDRVLARVELPDLAAAAPLVVGGGKRPGKILPSPIKRASGTAPPPKTSSNNPLAYFDVLSGAGANARGLTSANAMRQLATGFLLYEQSRGGFPDTLDQLGEVLGDMDALLDNQRTGDNPGFLYEKPTGGGVEAMVWESLGGQKDPTGAVLMSDGTIR